MLLKILPVAEILVIDELHELGIAIRFADYPDLDPIDADDHLMITISFTLARRKPF